MSKQGFITTQMFFNMINSYFKQIEIFESLPMDSPQVDIEGTVLDDLTSEIKHYLPFFITPQCENCVDYEKGCCPSPFCFKCKTNIIDDISLEEIKKDWKHDLLLNPYVAETVWKMVIEPIENHNYNKKIIAIARKNLKRFIEIVDPKLSEKKLLEKTLKNIEKMLEYKN